MSQYLKKQVETANHNKYFYNNLLPLKTTLNVNQSKKRDLVFENLFSLTREENNSKYSESTKKVR